MKTVSKCIRTRIYILAAILVGKNWADNIKMDSVTPLVGEPFFIRCTYEIALPSPPHVFTNPFTFTITGLDICTITDWKNCTIRKIDPLPDQSCECNNRSKISLQKDKIYQIYRFYFYSQKATEEWNGKQARCLASGYGDSQQVDVVTFMKKPEDPLYGCQGKSIRFNWEFNPHRQIIREEFKVQQIDWFVVTEEGELRICSYVQSQKVRNLTNPCSSSERNTLEEAANGFMKLKIKTLTPNDAGVIKIQVTFNRGSSTFPDRVDADILESLRNRERAHGNKALIAARPSRATTSTTTTTTTTTSTTSTTTTTTTELTTTTTATTTRIYPPEPPPHNTMKNSIKFIVTETPTLKGKIIIEGTLSIDGGLIIACEVKALVYPGKPPVNITMWVDDQTLISRQKTNLVRYSLPVVTKSTYTCGLEGRALDCLPKFHKLLTRAVLDKTKLKKADTPRHTVDLFLIMFALELVLCLVMMLWTVSLILDHIHILQMREKKRLVIGTRRVKRMAKHNYAGSSDSQTIRSSLSEIDHQTLLNKKSSTTLIRHSLIHVLNESTPQDLRKKSLTQFGLADDVSESTV